MIKKVVNEILLFILIAVVSLLIMLFYTKGQLNSLIVDDNYMQWSPIVEKTYETFFETGRMPLYDFYQMKGMEIGDCGYYGQHNILMMISYILGRIILGNIGTLSVYICISYILGNYLMYKLLRYIGNTETISIVTTLMYAGCSTFVYYSFWHYIWMNYFMIPLFLLVAAYVINNKNKLSYFLLGIVLVYSLSLGNVQYTFYMYMVYGILFLAIFIISQDKKIITLFFSNLLVGVLLSAPFLICQLDAAKRRDIIVTGASLLHYAVPVNKFFIFSLIPTSFWLKNSGEDLAKKAFAYDGSFCGTTFGFCYSGYFVAAFVVMTIIGIMLIIKKHRFNVLEHNNKAQFMREGIYFSALFFILFGFGVYGGVAYILSKLPVISEFKFSFKAIFIAVPLMAVIAADFLAFCKEHLADKIYYLLITVCIVFALLGIIDNYNMLNGDYHTFLKSQEIYDEAEIGKEIQGRLDATGIDYNNYRVVSVLCAEVEDYWAQDYELKRDNHKITYNMPTYAEVYSLGAYEPAISTKSFEQSGYLLKSIDYDFYRSNAISAFEVIPLLENDYDFYQGFISDIKNNSVKYLVFTRDSGYLTRFINVMQERGDLIIAGVSAFYDDTVIVTIDNVPALCENENGIKQNMTSVIDELVINVNNVTNNLNLAFTYNKHIRACEIDGNGHKHNLKVTSDKNGFISISGIENKLPDDSIVKVNYMDHLELISVLISWAISFIMVMIFVGLLLNNKNQAE